MQENQSTANLWFEKNADSKFYVVKLRISDAFIDRFFDFNNNLVLLRKT